MSIKLIEIDKASKIDMVIHSIEVNGAKTNSAAGDVQDSKIEVRGNIRNFDMRDSAEHGRAHEAFPIL